MDGKIPIIHIGRIENYYSFNKSIEQLSAEYDEKYKIIHILLWEEMKELERRIREREDNIANQEIRIRAAREEFQDNIVIIDHKKNPYSYIIKNSDCKKTCQTIIDIIENNKCSFGIGYDSFIEYVRKLS